MDTRKRNTPGIKTIARAVCKTYSISSSDLKGRNRERKYTDARMLYSLFVARDYTLKDGGDFISKDHATIHNRKERALELLELKTEIELKAKVETIARKIYGYLNLPDKEEFDNKALIFKGRGVYKARLRSTNGKFKKVDHGTENR
jgi:hypothetical protein